MAFYSSNPISFESVSAVTATPSVELGTIRVEALNKYVYAYNAGAAQLSVGMPAFINSSNSNYSVSVSNAASQVCNPFVGVCHHATIAAGSYGWLVAKGISKVVPDASAVSGAAGIDLTAGVDGGFVAMTGTTMSTGLRLAFTIASFTTLATGTAWIYSSIVP
jgi:hypothetical protein